MPKEGSQGLEMEVLRREGRQGRGSERLQPQNGEARAGTG